MSTATNRVVGWLKRYRLWLVGLGFAVLFGYTWWTETRPAPVAEQGQLRNLTDIETLRARFNEDAGQTRLIFLLSPT